MIRCCSKDRVDKNKINNGKTKNERELCHICPSKLSKRELEDLYYMLLTQNLELKQLVNDQSEKLKQLSTKVQRNTELQKLNGAKDNKDKDCCIASRNLVQEQKNLIFDLKRHNLFLKDQIKMLNMKLCSAKQFLKRGQQNSSAKAIRAYSSGPPKPNSVKSGSNRHHSAASASTVSSKRKDEPAEKETDDETPKIIHVEVQDRKHSSNRESTEMKPTPPANDGQKSEAKKDNKAKSLKSTSFDLLRVTEIPREPDESVRSSCDENNCRNLMQEMRQHIEILTKELTKTHDEYSQRISKLEEEVSALHSENMQMLHEQANQERYNRDVSHKLAMERAESETLLTDLKIQKRKVAELETQIKLDEMTQRTVDDVAGRRRDSKSPVYVYTANSEVPGKIRRPCACKQNNDKKNLDGDAKKCTCKPEPKSTDDFDIPFYPNVTCSCSEELQKKYKTWMDFFSKHDNPRPLTCQCKGYEPKDKDKSGEEAFIVSGNLENEEGALPTKALKDTTRNSETTEDDGLHETQSRVDTEKPVHLCESCRSKVKDDNEVIDTGTLRIRVYKKSSEIKPLSEPESATKQKEIEHTSHSPIETRESSSVPKSQEGANNERLRNDLVSPSNKTQEAADTEKTLVGRSDSQEPNKTRDAVDRERSLVGRSDSQEPDKTRDAVNTEKTLVGRSDSQEPDKTRHAVITEKTLVGRSDSQEPDKTPDHVRSETLRVQTPGQLYKITVTRDSLEPVSVPDKKHKQNPLKGSDQVGTETPLAETPDQNKDTDITASQIRRNSRAQEILDAIDIENTRAELIGYQSDKESSEDSIETFMLRDGSSLQETPDKVKSDSPGVSPPAQKQYKAVFIKLSKEPASIPVVTMKHRLLMTSRDKTTELQPVAEKKESQENVQEAETQKIGSSPLEKSESKDISNSSKPLSQSEYQTDRNLILNFGSTEVPNSPKTSPRPKHGDQRSGTQKANYESKPTLTKHSSPQTSADHHQRSGAQKLANTESAGSPKLSPQPTNANYTQRSESQEMVAKDVPDSSKPSPEHSGAQKLAAKKDAPRPLKDSPRRPGSQKTTTEKAPKKRDAEHPSVPLGYTSENNPQGPAKPIPASIEDASPPMPLSESKEEDTYNTELTQANDSDVKDISDKRDDSGFAELSTKENQALLKMNNDLMARVSHLQTQIEKLMSYFQPGMDIKSKHTPCFCDADIQSLCKCEHVVLPPQYQITPPRTDRGSSNVELIKIIESTFTENRDSPLTIDTVDTEKHISKDLENKQDTNKKNPAKRVVGANNNWKYPKKDKSQKRSIDSKGPVTPPSKNDESQANEPFKEDEIYTDDALKILSSYDSKENKDENISGYPDSNIHCTTCDTRTNEQMDSMNIEDCSKLNVFDCNQIYKESELSKDVTTDTEKPQTSQVVTKVLRETVEVEKKFQNSNVNKDGIYNMSNGATTVLQNEIDSSTKHPPEEKEVNITKDHNVISDEATTKASKNLTKNSPKIITKVSIQKNKIEVIKDTPKRYIYTQEDGGKEIEIPYNAVYYDDIGKYFKGNVHKDSYPEHQVTEMGCGSEVAAKPIIDEESLLDNYSTGSKKSVFTDGDSRYHEDLIGVSPQKNETNGKVSVGSTPSKKQMRQEKKQKKPNETQHKTQDENVHKAEKEQFQEIEENLTPSHLGTANIQSAIGKDVQYVKDPPISYVSSEKLIATTNAKSVEDTNSSSSLEVEARPNSKRVRCACGNTRHQKKFKVVKCLCVKDALKMFQIKEPDLKELPTKNTKASSTSGLNESKDKRALREIPREKFAESVNALLGFPSKSDQKTLTPESFRHRGISEEIKTLGSMDTDKSNRGEAFKMAIQKKLSFEASAHSKTDSGDGIKLQDDHNALEQTSKTAEADGCLKSGNLATSIETPALQLMATSSPIIHASIYEKDSDDKKDPDDKKDSDGKKDSDDKNATAVANPEHHYDAESECKPQKHAHIEEGNQTEFPTYSVDVPKANRATSPVNTDQEISSLTDLPTESDKQQSEYAMLASPGEERTDGTNITKHYTAYMRSYVTDTDTMNVDTEPTHTESFGTPLSDGEMPQPFKGPEKNVDDTTPPQAEPKMKSSLSRPSPTSTVELALAAIERELARCRDLLGTTHDPPKTLQLEEPKKVDKGASMQSLLTTPPSMISLRRAEGKSRLSKVQSPRVIFTLHIGTIVLSDEAVINTKEMSLVLTWKFYDQNVAMSRIRSGRVVHFDFSTEYDLKLTDEFLMYLKTAELPIMICESNRLDDPLASCALPLREALLHTNRRADMSLALMAGPSLKRSVSTAHDPLDTGDEMGVLDLWCMLRADPRVVPHINRAIAKSTRPSLGPGMDNPRASSGAIMAQINEDDQDDMRLSADLDPIEIDKLLSPSHIRGRAASIALQDGLRKSLAIEKQNIQNQNLPSPDFIPYSVHRSTQTGATQSRLNQNRGNSGYRDSAAPFPTFNPSTIIPDPDEYVTGDEVSRADEASRFDEVSRDTSHMRPTFDWDPRRNEARIQSTTGLVINEMPSPISTSEQMKEAVKKRYSSDDRTEKKHTEPRDGRLSLMSIRSLVRKRRKKKEMEQKAKLARVDSDTSQEKPTREEEADVVSLTKKYESMSTKLGDSDNVDHGTSEDYPDPILRGSQTEDSDFLRKEEQVIEEVDDILASTRLNNTNIKIEKDASYTEEDHFIEPLGRVSTSKAPDSRGLSLQSLEQALHSVPDNSFYTREAADNLDIERICRQSIDITILWLALNEECSAMGDPGVQRLYVAYRFLGRSGAELETPLSLPKPKQSHDKCYFNFKKSFQLKDYDLAILGRMAKCRTPQKGYPNDKDAVVFTVVSEPVEDPLGLNNCEDIGYAHLYFGDLLAYSAGSDSYTEVIPVRSVQDDLICGVLAVRVDGLDVVRKCVILDKSATDLRGRKSSGYP